jgi:hypothetical protein
MFPGVLFAALAVETGNVVLLLMVKSSAIAGQANNTQAAPDATTRMFTKGRPPTYRRHLERGGEENANRFMPGNRMRAVLTHAEQERRARRLKFGKLVGAVHMVAWLHLSMRLALC